MPEDVKTVIAILVAITFAGLFIGFIATFLYRLAKGTVTYGDFLERLFFWWPFR
ncbi:MAG: hypothetical protein Rhims3KO_12150 [Hyphomicrobiales bacterium]